MSSIENEDLENGPLVRMEDVQPSRDRVLVDFHNYAIKYDNKDSYIVDDLNCDNECVVDEDDSNIGSMVSIHSEEVVDCDNEVTVSDEQDLLKVTIAEADKKPLGENKLLAEGWPTLEIWPGGVIKHSDQSGKETDSIDPDSDKDKDNEMMYACAKCSESFKFLYCLVKHVRSHEKEEEKQKVLNPPTIITTKVTKRTNNQQLSKGKVLKKTIKRKTQKKPKS